MQENLLRQANEIPKVSEYAYLKVPHDVNCMPMSPLRCAIRSTKILTPGNTGHPTSSVVSTSERPESTITATMYGAEKQVQKEYEANYNSNTNISNTQQ